MSPYVLLFEVKFLKERKTLSHITYKIYNFSFQKLMF